MSLPVKMVFSQKYRSYGICGAFGLLDHGFCEGSDMAQAQTCTGRRGERERSETEESDLGARWKEGKGEVVGGV